MELITKIIEKQLTPTDIADILDMHPFDLVRIYEQLPSEAKEYLISFLNEEIISELLSYLPPKEAAQILEPLDLETKKNIINQIDPDDAADIIIELEEEDSTSLIESLGEQNKIVALLKFSENQIGSYMNNSFILANENDGVKEATKKLIKTANEYSSIQTIFVVDESSKYVGQMPLKTLLKSKPPLLVSEILTYETTFNENDDIEQVVDYMKEFSDNDVPIVNNDGQLVGVITASDIIELLHEEAVEDFARLSGLKDAKVTKNIFKSAIKRLPWLVSLLVMSLFIAMITSKFEEILQATVILAFFQPLILDVGGDVASQSLAVTLVTLNKEDASLKKTARKEIISGLIVAAILSFVSFGITYVLGSISSYGSPLHLSFVVSLSLLLTVILGFFFGFSVPVILSKLKADPSVASGPFITTSIDILSLVVYFLLATIIL